MAALSSQPLFAPSLIPPEAVSAFPDPFRLRPLQRDDYARGFLDCLRALTHVGEVTEEQFQERFDWMATKGKDIHHVLVVENEGRIVGTAALLVERKFLNNLAMVAYVEDVAILDECQGKGLGLKLMNALSSMARSLGCLKSKLGCSEEKEAFYVKCGYDKGGRLMLQHF